MSELSRLSSCMGLQRRLNALISDGAVSDTDGALLTDAVEEMDRIHRRSRRPLQEGIDSVAGVPVTHEIFETSTDPMRSAQILENIYSVLRNYGTVPQEVYSQLGDSFHEIGMEPQPETAPVLIIADKENSEELANTYR